MAAQSAIFQWGPLNRMFFGTAYPTLAGEGPYQIGDVVVNTAPTAGGTFLWVCVTAGTGASSTWKAVAVAA